MQATKFLSLAGLVMLLCGMISLVGYESELETETRTGKLVGVQVSFSLDEPRSQTGRAPTLSIKILASKTTTEKQPFVGSCSIRRGVMRWNIVMGEPIPEHVFAMVDVEFMNLQEDEREVHWEDFEVRTEDGEIVNQIQRYGSLLSVPFAVEVAFSLTESVTSFEVYYPVAAKGRVLIERNE